MKFDFPKIPPDKTIKFIDDNQEIQDWLGTIKNFRYINPKSKIISITKIKENERKARRVKTTPILNRNLSTRCNPLQPIKKHGKSNTGSSGSQTHAIKEP